ncbi:MAG: pilin [bacterium]|nr:pilin [bacterium]
MFEREILVMINVLKKIGVRIALLVLILNSLSFALAAPVNAQGGVDVDYYFQTGDNDQLGDTVKLGKEDPRKIAANVINVILGFLGLMAVVIILAGGFKWMTASGNQDRVEEAKKLISAGIIGLVIVMASFGIAVYVVKSLVVATGV